MYQQINLYQPVFKRQRKVFSAVTLLQICGIAAVLLLGLYLHARWTLHTLDTTVTTLSTHYQQLNSQLGTLEQATASDLNVTAEIEQLEQTLRQREALLDNFARLDLRGSVAFSEFFETLGRRIQPGLWLTGISLTEEGDTELRGSTLNPTLVPRYLQAMPDEPRFVALHNGSVHLTRAAADAEAVEFTLSSTNEEAP